MSKYITIRKQRLSFLLDKNTLIILASLLLISSVLIILSVGTGEMSIPPLDVVKALFGYGSNMHNLVVQSFRLPRILLAFLAGMALATSGAILQGIIRNPLASPDIIGITGGAAFATVSFLTIFSNGRDNALTVSIHWLPLAAFIGAMAISMLVYFLSWKKGVSPTRLVLIGIGIAAAMQALTNVMILVGPIYLASRATIWITGSVNGTNWSEVLTLLPWFLILFTLTIGFTRKLNVQELGEDLAQSLGNSVQRNRIVLLMISTALTGGAVAFAGGIGFVGLMAPHIGRRLVGSSFGGLIPISALIGGVIVVLADLIARTIFSPIEIPAGVFTSAIGAPYFIYLLFKQRNA